MENPSSVPGPVAGIGRASLSDVVPQLPEHWRLARAAHVDLLLMGMPRVNLLLIAPDAVVRYVLESLLLNLREPIARWAPGQPLVLPPPGLINTMVLHDVGRLRPDEQFELLAWLERADGRTQVVSTSATPLLPRVQCGAFIDTLYYRLNTVCVDVTGG
jgi:Sigma-54 interaction domain